MLSSPVDRDVTVEFNTVDDTATGRLLQSQVIKFLHAFFHTASSGDYTPVIQTITFPAGETSVTVPVDTLDDSLSEDQEMLGATLSNPQGNGLPFSLGAQDTATVEIEDDDCKIITRRNHSSC